jgi:UDP-glucose:(heptosyl)LPS alpha-1,3-glucosyltransferase
MRLAFAIVSLFPWGGLQRDCLRLARAAKEVGHEVTIFAARTIGELPRDLGVRVLPICSFTNHGRNRRFGEALRGVVAGGFDRVVGFNKMPGLDVLYCGDLCFAARKRGFLHQLNPRVLTMMALEGACFVPNSRTRVLALTEPQIEAYRRAWQTPAHRIALLPPPIDRARYHPEFRKDGTRERMRAGLGLGPEILTLLSIGTWARTKGFDRTVSALAELPPGTLLVCGIGPESREGTALLNQARTLEVADRVRLLGPREDVPELMAAADVFVHPARTETAGIVILEAIINGLPVVTTEVCGFSCHVRNAGAGIVIPEPFAIAELINGLRRATERCCRATWSAQAVSYAADRKLYSGIDQALQAILDAKDVREPNS